MTDHSNEHDTRSVAPLQGLSRFAQERGRALAATPAEHCEICSEIIPSDHRHLLNLTDRSLTCVCQACALLFSENGAGSGKYRLVPRRYRSLPDFSMTDGQWDALMIPVNMAFLLRSTGTKPVQAFYPGPAGAIESLLDLAAWEELASDNPVLYDLEPDVEAILINRVKNAREHYLVPIDTCYEFVGLIRLSWKGLGGGTEVWETIEAFFADIRKKAQPVKGGTHARPEL